MSTLHALIVDDDPYSIDVVAQMLRAAHITFTAVHDSSKLEQALAGVEHVDLAFVDLEMPKRDGYTVLEILRTILGDSAYVIAHTVHITEINHARQVGFNSFIGKPVHIDRFPKQLSRILNGEDVWETR
jgi:CheY-like chemotaxis protein